MGIKPYLVGIAGGSASGKSSFIEDLRNALPNNSVTVVSQDNYYFPKEKQQKDENGWINFDLPTAIDRDLFLQDLEKLCSGESIETTEYTFNNNDKDQNIIQISPRPIIIMEGLFVFHYEEIREKLDLRIYIDVQEQIKLHRRLKRDKEERGYPEDEVRYQWEHHVIPSYKKYLRPYRDDAHIIVTNNSHFTKGLEVVANHLKTKLEEVPA